MEAADGRMETAQAVVGEWRHHGADFEPTGVLSCEASGTEGADGRGAEQGAAASRRGGESEQVGDRSRTENGRPEGAHVFTRYRVAPAARRPHGRPDDGSGSHRAAQAGPGSTLVSFGSARPWRGVRLDGRTFISTESAGRCRIPGLHIVN